MKLSDDARLALTVMRWALANGWKVKDRTMSLDGHDRSTTWANGVDAAITISEFRSGAAILWDASDVDVRSVVQAVDVLVAFELVPAKFSSAFRAGVESVYDRIEYRVVAPPDGVYPIVHYSTIEAFRSLGYVRRNGRPDAFLEQRFDKEPSGWSRVPEAGGTDANA